MKIYTDDRLVPYKNTTIDPLSTKAEIDGLLARWGIRTAYASTLMSNEKAKRDEFREKVSKLLEVYE